MEENCNDLTDPKKMEKYLELASKVERAKEHLYKALKEYLLFRDPNSEYGYVHGNVMRDTNFMISIPPRKVPDWFKPILWSED